PERGYLCGRRPGQGGDRVESGDERGAFGSDRGGRRVRVLALEVRWRRGEQRQGTRGSERIRGDRVCVLPDGESGGRDDERMPAARGEWTATFHDAALRSAG